MPKHQRRTATIAKLVFWTSIGHTMSCVGDGPVREPSPPASYPAEAVAPAPASAAVAPHERRVVFDGLPSGIPVTVDSTEVTFSGEPFRLSPGVHVFAINDACLGAATREVTVPESGALRVDFGVRLPTGTLEFVVKSKKGDAVAAHVIRGGVYQGSSLVPQVVPTCAADDPLLREVDIDITADGYEPAELRLVLAPGEHRRVDVVLKGAPTVYSPAAQPRAWAEREAACEAEPTTCYRRGHVALEDRTAGAAQYAVRFFTRACDAGELAGCYNAAYVLTKWPLDESGAAAVNELYTRSCERGFGLSCNNLAWAAQAGLAREVDYQQAGEFYARSCGLNNRAGCSGLGGLIYRGVYPAKERDIPTAFRVHLAACLLETREPGLNWGCYFAAEIMRHHPEEAAVSAASSSLPTAERSELLDRACGSGITEACRLRRIEADTVPAARVPSYIE